jgi:hypothetical protein
MLKKLLRRSRKKRRASHTARRIRAGEGAGSIADLTIAGPMTAGLKIEDLTTEGQMIEDLKIADLMTEDPMIAGQTVSVDLKLLRAAGRTAEAPRLSAICCTKGRRYLCRSLRSR